MWIIQRCQRREEREKQQHMTDQYNLVRLWDARERERDMYPRPITTATQALLREVGLLKFYEEATSLKGHNGLLQQLIFRWNSHRQALRVGPNQWYAPTEEDIYFITSLSRRGVDFPSFPEVPVGYAIGNQLGYSQRYISTSILSSSIFQVSRGQLRIASFGGEEVRCLSLLISTISHHTSDGKRISCPLLFYVDSLLQAPWLVRWYAIFLVVVMYNFR